MRRFSAILLLILAISCPAFSASKVVVVPFTNAGITVDGRLTEGAWKKAGRIASFEHYMKPVAIRNQTLVLLAYDSSALYIAYKCGEANMSALKSAVRAHDANVWDDDAADFLLDPKADGASFYQFIANTAGGKYDGLGNDSFGFNPKWDARAQIGKDVWVLEVRIPFSEIGVRCPKSGDSWLGSFCREEQPSNELSCWNGGTGSFSSPGAFGQIVFGSLKDKALRDISRVEADAGRSTEARKFVADARPFIPSRGDIDEARYRKVEASLRAAGTAIAEMRLKARRAAMGNPDYIVWETSPWKHYAAKEDVSSIDRQTERLDVTVLAGQTESNALMVSNLTTETLSARLVVDGMPKGAVEVLLPTFVRAADGRPFPDALVPPDPIGQIVIPAGETRQIWLNFRGDKAGKLEGTLTISPLTASKKDAQVKLAVQVVVPPKELPRPIAFTWDYLGDAEANGLVDEYIRTMVDHGITAFMISGLRYMPRPKADDQGKLLEPMDWSRFKEHVKLIWRPGRKLYINMDVWEKASERPIYNGKFDTPGWRVAFKTVIGEMVGVLKDMGLSYDDYWVCPVDECVDERYVAIARLLREVDPSIRIISDSIGSNLDQVKEADKLTDHWVPHFNNFRAEGTKASVSYLKSTGKPLGMYYYSEGANEKAQDSYNHYLWRLWYAYSQGLDGLIGYWTATQHYGSPWNRHQTEAHYDPSLFYPGNGVVITGRRWEAWRRGIEDIALLRLCEECGVDKAVISRAVESVMSSPTDPTAADRARAELIQALK